MKKYDDLSHERSQLNANFGKSSQYYTTVIRHFESLVPCVLNRHIIRVEFVYLDTLIIEILAHVKVVIYIHNR